MALADTEDYAGDLDEITADTPSTLVWGSQTITGTASAITEGVEVSEEFDYEPTNLDWVGTIADFTDSTLPALQTVVTVDSVKYHINAITKYQDGVGVIFGLRRL